MVRIKICGCRKGDDALAAAEAGADYVGVVFAERVRRVTPQEAAETLAPVLPHLGGVGVFVDAIAADVLNARDVAGFDVAQLHGSEPPALCESLRAEGLQVWKALRPRGIPELVEGLDLYAGVVDAILVEGFSKEAAGGTGTGFPIEWLAPVRGRFSDLDEAGGLASHVPAHGSRAPQRPRFVLAGGLDPGNVAEAIRRTQPSIVDVSSGVESSPGEKDPDLIQRFALAVRSS